MVIQHCVYRPSHAILKQENCACMSRFPMLKATGGTSVLCAESNAGWFAQRIPFNESPPFAV